MAQSLQGNNIEIFSQGLSFAIAFAETFNVKSIVFKQISSENSLLVSVQRAMDSLAGAEGQLTSDQVLLLCKCYELL